mmetsp:Transcript_66288/g.209552  ORF Transcript_66288/g.209552 Transcript_66288/m.209552 type:complete len:217 (-) Transcript_66288:1334-1984(-)
MSLTAAERVEAARRPSPSFRRTSISSFVTSVTPAPAAATPGSASRMRLYGNERAAASAGPGPLMVRRSTDTVCRRGQVHSPLTSWNPKTWGSCRPFSTSLRLARMAACAAAAATNPPSTSAATNPRSSQVGAAGPSRSSTGASAGTATIGARSAAAKSVLRPMTRLASQAQWSADEKTQRGPVKAWAPASHQQPAALLGRERGHPAPAKSLRPRES